MAEWIANTAEENVSSAFQVLRELPARPTERTSKLHTELEDAARRHDQSAFDGDEDTQRLRLAAYEAAWAQNQEALSAVKLRLVTPVFEQIHRHAAATWRPGGGADPASAGTGGGGSGSGSGGSGVAPPAAGTGSSDAEVPVVLLSVGASADHAHTCPDLAHYLRQRGHPVALANARDLSNGSPAPLLHAALRQFLGAPTPADDVAALVAWWADEIAERCGAAPTKRKKPALAAEARRLRPRKEAGGARAGAAAPLAAPVLVVSDGERCDVPALQQLIKELSERFSR
ncbi:hypothetical protein MNEG_4627 [Monoraphidium neglectum]|uniref:Uncharacterized protein n=1 Tax=Monoraphidium neglectum TaxID=145388 RepID=A0A0D2L916_9CHLO|nr:hypothetical protein MNEG_4627 [Monoraphidium neglectum]KIZ03339.1 hypothetical protein MNEG_4627 [Monoraphidium neglectum]|eukprot:XP_013902358.1 hypothetical protein MNEG_4627 [Monoraphidium neglectum]